MIIAFNIAPTDKVPMMAAAFSPWLLAIIAVSILVSYCIVFASGFTSPKKRHQQQRLFQRTLGKTVFSYLVSLLTLALILLKKRERKPLIFCLGERGSRGLLFLVAILKMES